MQNNSLLALSGVYHIKERLFSRLLRRHGMDHLSGADDHTECGFRSMRRRELSWIRALSDIG